MNTLGWIAEYWYVVTGIGGGILVLALNSRARRHPSAEFSSQWERLKYSVFACVALVGMLMLLDVVVSVLTPGESMDEVFFSPYFAIAAYVLCWLGAPYLKSRLPLVRAKQ